jgi:hypothetical protein
MRSYLAMFSVLAAMMFASPVALAQSAPSAPVAPSEVIGKVSVDVMFIHATNADNRVDAALTNVVQHFRHLPFTGFHFLSSELSSLAIGQSRSIMAPGGRRLQLDALSANSAEAKLRFQMFRADQKILDLTFSVHRNKAFIVGGPSYEDGKLVFVVNVKY